MKILKEEFSKEELQQLGQFLDDAIDRMDGGFCRVAAMRLLKLLEEENGERSH